jgi:peptide-methionine (S)-S-oxide reductase
MMPSREDALKGRAEKMPVPETHHVNGARLQEPFPDGL